MSGIPSNQSGATGEQPGQLQLQLSEPAGRAYKSSAAPPRHRRDPSVWTAHATALGAFLNLVILVYLIVFTDPSRSENVLSLLAVLGFGTLFATWSVGYWVRAARALDPGHGSTWAITRQAVLVASGIEALAVLDLSRVAQPGAILLVVLVVTTAELVLRRMNLTP